MRNFYKLVGPCHAVMAAGLGEKLSANLSMMVANVDHLPGSQSVSNAHWHAMRQPGESLDAAQAKFLAYVEDSLSSGTLQGLARGLHAIQDFYAPAHMGFQEYHGMFSLGMIPHLILDSNPSLNSLTASIYASENAIERFYGR